MIETDQVRAPAARHHRDVRVAATSRRLEPPPSWPAAVWGCALGLDAAVTAALVYAHTHAFGLAALSGVGALTASAATLVVALTAAARRRS
ncbi:MAG TPA: hypothetical protein VF186_06795 [Gaiellaceae bacterium]